MASQIGRSTDPSTMNKLDPVNADEVASFRYNNPGAQWPSERAARFGQLGYGMIGGNNKIARFPSPVNGAAANFDLLMSSSKYVGKTIGEAGKTWTGGHSFGVPGFPSSKMLTKEMIEDPVSAIPFLKAIAHRESGKGSNLTEEMWRQAHAMFKAGSADAFLNAVPVQIVTPGVAAPGKPSGAHMLEEALEHVGEAYDFVQVPKDNASYKGPFDCAEFVSWLVFQEAGVLRGCDRNDGPANQADAFTGFWKRDVESKLVTRISVQEAAGTVGAILLRYPPPGPGKMGHIAISDGKGGTVEAKGKRFGVVRDTVKGRRWDTGVLVPEIHTAGASSPLSFISPAVIYEVNAPNMDQAVVTRIQQALRDRGFDPGDVDGDFGPNTEKAVIAFQQAQGLTIDGEVGPETAGALGVSLTGGTVVLPQDIPNDFPIDLQTGDSSRQLLALILMLLSKEKPMAADPAKPGQGFDLLLPLILMAALSGKQIDPAQILTTLLTGKPVALSGTQPSETVPAPQQPGQPLDLMTLLLPFLYEKLTGKPLPGTEPKVDKPTDPNTPVMSKPSVQLSAGALGIVTLLQAFGQVGLPFNLGAAANLPASASTTTGTLSTLIPLVVGGIGATGGWGALAGIAANLFGKLINAATSATKK